MDRDAIRRKVGKGLKPALSAHEWTKLLDHPVLGAVFEEGELEDGDIEDAQSLIEWDRRNSPVHVEPSFSPASGTERGAAPEDGPTDLLGPPTSTERVWLVVVALQAAGLPEVERYRKRYLPTGFIQPDQVPAFLAERSERVVAVEEYVPASGPAAMILYEGVSYRGHYQGPLAALRRAISPLQTRYGLGTSGCVRLVVCGKPRAGLPRRYAVGNLMPDYRGLGVRGIMLRVPCYAHDDEVIRLYHAARAMLSGSGPRFNEKTAQEVEVIAAGLAEGRKLSDIVREFPKPGSVRTTFYRVLRDVGQALGPPPAHGRRPRSG